MAVKLNISHLQMIKAVADHGTVSRAARRLNITQPALSHRIREAESRLGTTLFNRVNKRLTLTMRGKRLLSSATSILELLEHAEHDIEKMRDGIDEVVRVSARTYSCYRWLPQTLKTFQQTHPNVDIEIVADAILDPLRALEQGRIDLAIVSGRPNAKKFGATKLFDDELVAILPKGHELSTREYLTPKDFVSETYITNDTRTEKGREYDLFFSREDTQPGKIIQAGLTEAIVELVRSNFGIAILTRWVLQPHLRSEDLVIIPLTKKKLYVEWYAATRKAENPNSTTLQLVDEIANTETD